VIVKGETIGGGHAVTVERKNLPIAITIQNVIVTGRALEMMMILVDNGDE
jgi:hypothetical protein